MTMEQSHYDQKVRDIEYGYNNYNNSQDILFPPMLDNPSLRWGFIRKVYAIISMQLLFTVAVATTVVFYHPIPRLITETTTGLVAYIGIIIATFLLMIPLYFFHKRHPVNILLLTLFTIGISFSLGLSCAYTKGFVVLEAAIICSIVVISLTLYTFWAVRRGSDFSFIGPFLFASFLVLAIFALIQMYHPLGQPAITIYSALGSILFCAFIIHDTGNMIKRHSYDDYIWAAVALYLDMISLFQTLLILLGVASD